MTGPGLRVVTGHHGGYVQAIDRDGLVTLAEQQDLVIEILRRPGDFALAGEALLAVRAPDDRLTAEQMAKLRKAFSLGRVRTSTQDVRYGANQLTEIASRALSPGINDPFTAISCIDWLIDALVAMAGRPELPTVLAGDGGFPRLLEEQICTGDVMALTLGPLRGYACGDATVMAYLLGALARLARQVDAPKLRAAVAAEALDLAAAAQASLSTRADRLQVGTALDAIATALRRP